MWIYCIISFNKRNDTQRTEWDWNLLVYCLRVWNVLSHIIPDLWQPRDKAAIENWKNPNEAKSTELYTVNKIDIKGLCQMCTFGQVRCRVASGFGKSAYWASLFDLSKIINAVVIHL